MGQAGEAMRDFEEVNARFPKAPERELALYQKGRIQGQLNDNSGMAKTFRQLLKDFPQSAAAAEANYWIGWVAFEKKEYRAVTEPLAAARKLDRERYFELASLKILWALFYLEDRPALAQEIEAYQSGGAKRPVPYDIVHWLGQKSYEAGNESGQRAEYDRAAKFLGILVDRGDARSNDVLNLGRSQMRSGRFAEAVPVFKKFVGDATEPSVRALGLLQLGEAFLGVKDFDAARKSAEEALGLQPDGELNAKARVLVGDIQRAQGALEDAAKIYELVGVVIDEESITPGALEKAVEVYRELGREADAKRVLNRLQSRYPEYAQRRKLL
jgi:TolA-binding protein